MHRNYRQHETNILTGGTLPLADRDDRETTSERSSTALVLATGVVGVLVNGFVLYVMCASTYKSKKQPISVLFINQLCLDLFSCTWLVIFISLKLASSKYTPTNPAPNTNGSVPRHADNTSIGGHFLCMFITSGAIVRYGMIGSAVNLASIAIERYIMIVHPIWHKNHFRPSINHAAVITAWANGILAVQPATSMQFKYENGTCGVHDFNVPGSSIYYVWLFVSYFCVIFVVIVVCYARIAVASRRRVGVFADRPGTDSRVQVRAVRVHMNAVKTAIFISIAFVACWLPGYVYVLSMHVQHVLGRHESEHSTGHEVTKRVAYILAFVNCSLNPFVYAARFDPVKNHLAGLAKRIRGAFDRDSARQQSAVGDA